MNKAERAERNIRVVLMRMREVPTRQVAEAFGITDRQVRRIMAEWRESPLRRDTEGAIEAVESALKAIRDDMEALGITSAQAPPEARVAIQAARMEQLNRNFSVLRNAGVSFEGLYEDRDRDLGLVIDVNAAFRKTLDEYGVDPKATADLHRGQGLLRLNQPELLAHWSAAKRAAARLSRSLSCLSRTFSLRSLFSSSHSSVVRPSERIPWSRSYLRTQLVTDCGEQPRASATSPADRPARTIWTASFLNSSGYAGRVPGIFGTCFSRLSSESLQVSELAGEFHLGLRTSATSTLEQIQHCCVNALNSPGPASFLRGTLQGTPRNWSRWQPE